MSDDWKPGDLALCVRGGPRAGARASQHPRAGQIVTVEGVCMMRTVAYPKGILAIQSRDLPPNVAGQHKWRADRFRKVTPPEADEFDREVISLMNGKPAKIGETA